MKKILLDTNAFTALAYGNEKVREFLSQADKIYLPYVVVAELLYGFKKGNRETKNRAVLKAFEAKLEVTRIYATAETLEIYSEVFLELKNNDTPIPVNDVWIAACAIETGSVVVTFDKHFTNISKLRLWQKLK